MHELFLDKRRFCPKYAQVLRVFMKTKINLQNVVFRRKMQFFEIFFCMIKLLIVDYFRENNKFSR